MEGPNERILNNEHDIVYKNSNVTTNISIIYLDVKYEGKTGET